MKIVTLTLNPAFDIHCYAENFYAEKENFASITSKDSGGKGVNISRALQKNGVENTALVVLGDGNAEDFCEGLKRENISFIPITLKGRIRENITIHTKTASETRLSFEGFDADESLVKKVDSAVSDMLEKGSVVTLTGSFPKGVSVASIEPLLEKWKNMGVKIVIDSRNFTLSDLIRIRPWLIKPNQEEISLHLGREISDFESVHAAATKLFESGIENVMISLGAKGALMVNADGAFIATPPKCTPVSTIGAGDSSIAGFAAAAVEGKGTEDCLKLAMAYGNAACLTEGTNPPEPEEVSRILKEVKVEKI